MNVYLKTFLLLLTGLLISIQLKAQDPSSTLNQQVLFKQFLGSWKSEVQKDTFLIIENSSFGVGMISKSYIETNSKTIEQIIQLYGYNAKEDCFDVAELIQSSSVLEIIKGSFTSETTGEMEVLNTENAKFKWRFEFKNKDTILQQALFDNKVVKDVVLKRFE